MADLILLQYLNKKDWVKNKRPIHKHHPWRVSGDPVQDCPGAGHSPGQIAGGRLSTGLESKHEKTSPDGIQRRPGWPILL